MIGIFFATFGAVFIAEIVGDKLLYTTGILATRYRSASIILGMALAFMCKMAVAVAIGAAISRLPRALVATITGVSFLGVAITLWRKPDVREPKPKDTAVLRGAAVAFAAIFFSEWGDVGQITAASMAMKYVWSAREATTTAVSVPIAAVCVWLGAVGAMVTKGTLVSVLGAGIRHAIAARIQPRIVRYVATAAIVVLGVLSVLETLGILTD